MRVGVHLDRVADIGPVEPAEIAIRVVEAHQAMNSRDLSECSIDRPMGCLLSHALNTNAHQRSQPGLGTPQ
jgi:hypothetical protein